MKIKAVIVGCAHMHVNEIALYIHSQPDTELCGIADVAPELDEDTEKRYTRAWNFKNIVNNYQAKPYDDYIDMLEEVRPDVAYLLCENSRKANIAGQIASRGIDIIIEKPMALTLAEARGIIALEKKYGVNVFVNWPVIWRKYVRQFKAMLDSGACGEIKKLRYINGHTGPLGKGAKHRGVAVKADEMTDEERSRIWWYRSECGGGAFLDILCYGCFFTLWTFGDSPKDIMAYADNLSTPFGDVEDNLVAIVRYENGFSVCEGTWTTPRRRMPTGPEAVCSNGVIWCDGVPDGEAFVAAADIYGNDIDVLSAEDDDSYRNMPWHYAAFKLYGKEIHQTLTAKFNARVVAMIEAARRSNDSRTAEEVAIL